MLSVSSAGDQALKGLWGRWPGVRPGSDGAYCQHMQPGCRARGATQTTGCRAQMLGAMEGWSGRNGVLTTEDCRDELR